MPAATTIVVHTMVHSSDLGTTILAAFGVLLAVASLGWQWYTFVWSGSRVRVVLKAGATDGYRYIMYPNALAPADRKHLARQGMTQSVFAVEVSNTGRGPTSVQSVHLLFPRGASFTGEYLRPSPDLPHRMEGESETTWIFDGSRADDVAQALVKATDLGPSITMRGQVKIGGKEKPVVSKNEMRIL